MTDENNFDEGTISPEEYRRQEEKNQSFSPLERFGSHIVTLTDPEDSLHEFELYLRNWRLAPDGTYIHIGGKKWKPKMNDEGINSILMSMQSILNKTTPLSNIDDWEVATLIRHLGYSLVDDLMLNCHKYELSVTDRQVVAGAALRFCFLFLKRPYHEGDRKFFGKISSETKVISEDKSRSSIGSIFGWGKK